MTPRSSRFVEDLLALDAKLARREVVGVAAGGPCASIWSYRMSLPIPVGRLWVTVVALPTSRETEEWYGRWFIYDRRPDLEKNAEIRPIKEGITANFPDEHQADRAAKMEGRRQALVMHD